MDPPPPPPPPPGCDTSLHGPSYPPIGEIYFDVKGVEKLLSNIDANKATGPDQVPCRILKELSAQIAPMLTAIFTQSFTTGKLSSQWSAAFVTPVFKKGPVCQAENYRPVSLTCVTCKLMEHILCSHIRSHLDLHGILSPLQHGFELVFPVRHSCLPLCMTYSRYATEVCNWIWLFSTSARPSIRYGIAALWPSYVIMELSVLPSVGLRLFSTTARRVLSWRDATPPVHQSHRESRRELSLGPYCFFYS